MAGRDRLPLGLLAAFWAALYLPHLLVGDTLPARDVAATQLPWRTVWRGGGASRGGPPPGPAHPRGAPTVAPRPGWPHRWAAPPAGCGRRPRFRANATTR